ncbi:MAG TPA: response regulator transcription factor [Alphaproteobacteria bacterium]|nr:response regulator transcription factor [Alphaproteobacteria bacterium]
MIFLVEDEEKLRRMYSDFLAAKGYDVAVADNGNEALLRLPVINPDIVLLDINLPDISGIEVCRRARDFLDDDVPIIFLTAFDGAEHVKAALDAGGNDYVLKTTPLEALLGRIQYWTSPGTKTKRPEWRGEALNDISALLSRSK